MPYPEFVDMPQPAGRVDREPQHVRRAHPPAADHLGDVLAVNELEDQVGVFVRGQQPVRVHHRHHVAMRRVLESLQYVRFTTQPLQDGVPVPKDQLHRAVNAPDGVVHPVGHAERSGAAQPMPHQVLRSELEVGGQVLEKLRAARSIHPRRRG